MSDGENVLLLSSGLGGTGQTTLALVLAETAARHADGKLRVLVVDASDRADSNLLLKVPNRDATLRTARQLSLTDDAEAAITGSEELNRLRPDDAEPVGFSIVFVAPAGEHTAPSDYVRIVEHAREHYDLVVVSTGLTWSDSDRISVASRLAASNEKSMVVGLANMNAPTIEAMHHGLKSMHQDGIAAERLHTMLLRTDRKVMRFGELSVHESLTKLPDTEEGNFLGSTAEDPSVRRETHLGHLPVGHESLRGAVGNALSRVTGDPSFQTGGSIFGKPPRRTSRERPGVADRIRSIFQRGGRA